MFLDVINLTVFYDSVLALDNISLTINEGEIVALIGQNGAGKSTTLKAICGLITPKLGEVLFQGKNIKGFKPYQLVNKGICLVPEGRRIFSSMTISENLEMGAYINNDKKTLQDGFDNVYRLFPVLKDRKKQKAGSLSSGEQQMLAIGRALMLKPKLLLLDEPTIGLSPNYVDAVFEKIQSINKDGTTILLVEQNARIALEYADRGYVFSIGKIEFEDKTENLLKTDNIRKAYLGD